MLQCSCLSFRSLPTVLTFLTGLVTTAALFLWIHQHEQKVEDFNFERRANAHIVAVQRRLADSAEALEFITGVFKASGTLDQEQFHSLTQPLLTRHPYIWAFGYQRLKPQPEPRRMDDPGNEFFIAKVVDADQTSMQMRNQYQVVDYVEPIAGNGKIFGLVLDDYSPRKEAVQRATDTGQAAATRLHSLVQINGGELGFEMLMPLYRATEKTDTVQERRAAVEGYTIALILVNELVDKIFETADPLNVVGIEVRLYAGTSPDATNLVTSRRAGPKIVEVGSPLLAKIYRDHPNALSQTFAVAGAPWHIVVSAQPPSFFDYHLGSVLAILVGLIFTSLATVYLHTLNQRTHRIQWLVDDRTAELKLANDRLVLDIAAREQAEAALRQTESALRQSEDSLRQLTAHLQSIKEQERQNIAREVHDELGGLLTGIKAYLSVVMDRQRRCGAPTDKLLQDAIDLADAGTEAVRRVITELRPSVLDQLGVWAAVEWYTGQIEERSGLHCQCIIAENVASLIVDSERSTMVFRIVQEALTNVVRHAQATRVTVEATRQQACLVVQINDDGKGISIDPGIKSGSWGIVGMYERARHFGGELKIEGVPGTGTCVELKLPLEDGHD